MAYIKACTSSNGGHYIPLAKALAVLDRIKIDGSPFSLMLWIQSF